MNKDRIRGTIKVSVGKAQAKLGDVTGNTGQEAKGLSKEFEGNLQRTFGDAKEKFNDELTKA